MGNPKSRVRTFIQRLFISLELFGQNGLANHAAAGAYGFLLSAVPALLLVSFILLTALRSSPQAVTRLIMNIDFFRDNFEDTQLIETFLSAAQPGISGIISVLSIFWAARIFAQSIQRGLKIIFPGMKAGNFLLDNLMIFIVEVLVILAAILLVLSSQVARMLYNVFGSLWGSFPAFTEVSGLALSLLPVAGLGLLSYCTYRMIPALAPSRLSALKGTIAGIISFKITSFLLHLFMNEIRYNFLYGALGNLIILLGDVYFFFYFYFFGAQIAFVIDSFDALLFSRFRRIQKQAPKFSNLIDRKLFASAGGRLLRYVRAFQEGETIFTRGEDSAEVYYLLSGEVGVYLYDAEEDPGAVTVLRSGAFFGETASLLSEARTATIKALKDTAALVLPPALFAEVLASDTNMDRAIIESLSKRLKSTNEKFRPRETV
ncbi:MAG: YihY/virulence factor BrkB family protein [Spirochaetales bacterium]|jgi:membrane protein|nr:YihY/virulence factor BrkB family protein [Spirochaetales bacterium]